MQAGAHAAIGVGDDGVGIVEYFNMARAYHLAPALLPRRKCGRGRRRTMILKRKDAILEWKLLHAEIIQRALKFVGLLGVLRNAEGEHIGHY